MSNPMLIVGGFILMALAFVAFMFALPSLNDATKTTAGSTWENSSEPIKGMVNTFNYMIMLIPFLLFFGGFGMLVAGTKGA